MGEVAPIMLGGLRWEKAEGTFCEPPRRLLSALAYRNALPSVGGVDVFYFAACADNGKLESLRLTARWQYFSELGRRLSLIGARLCPKLCL